MKEFANSLLPILFSYLTSLLLSTRFLPILWGIPVPLLVVVKLYILLIQIASQQTHTLCSPHPHSVTESPMVMNRVHKMCKFGYCF